MSKNEFKRPYKISKEFDLDDLLETKDPEEKNEYIDYVGKYILRRMRFGQRRLAKSKLVRIQAQLSDIKAEREAGRDGLDGMEMASDLTEWQNEMIVHTIISCPLGDQPHNGWGKGVDKIRAFVFNMPEKLGAELLDDTILLNDMTEDDQKN